MYDIVRLDILYVCLTYDIVCHIARTILYVRYTDNWHTIQYVWSSTFKQYRMSTHDIVERTYDIQGNCIVYYIVCFKKRTTSYVYYIRYRINDVVDIVYDIVSKISRHTISYLIICFSMSTYDIVCFMRYSILLWRDSILTYDVVCRHTI